MQQAEGSISRWIDLPIHSRANGSIDKA